MSVSFARGQRGKSVIGLAAALFGCAIPDSAPGQVGGSPGPISAGSPPAPAEVRAVWYNFYRLPPLKAEAQPLVDAHMKSLRALGVNRVYALVKMTDGFAFFDSKVCPRWSGLVADPDRPAVKRRVALDWDPLEHLVRAGAAQGIGIYAYVNVFCEGGEDADDQRRNPLLGPHPEWAVVNRRGQRVGWASPAHRGVVDYELGFLKDLARRYDVKGVQLDRIRFPNGSEAGGATVDYNPETVRQFNARMKRAAGAPDDQDSDWTRFRQDLVTDFVRSARREVKAIKPAMTFSASVFPNPASAARIQLQDWAAWVREGLLDEVCTMAYDTRPDAWEKTVAAEEQAVGGKIPLYVGIGAYKMDAAEELARHIAIARRRSVQGYVLFNAYSLFEKGGLAAALGKANRE